MPSWSFQGKLSVPYGNKREASLAVAKADLSPVLQCRWVTTPTIEGDQQVVKIPNLSAWVLRDCILHLCFLEFEVRNWNEWKARMANSIDYTHGQMALGLLKEKLDRVTATLEASLDILRRELTRVTVALKAASARQRQASEGRRSFRFASKGSKGL